MPIHFPRSSRERKTNSSKSSMIINGCEANGKKKWWRWKRSQRGKEASTDGWMDGFRDKITLPRKSPDETSSFHCCVPMYTSTSSWCTTRWEWIKHRKWRSDQYQWKISSVGQDVAKIAQRWSQSNRIIGSFPFHHPQHISFVGVDLSWSIGIDVWTSKPWPLLIRWLDNLRRKNWSGKCSVLPAGSSLSLFPVQITSFNKETETFSFFNQYSSRSFRIEFDGSQYCDLISLWLVNDSILLLCFCSRTISMVQNPIWSTSKSKIGLIALDRPNLSLCIVFSFAIPSTNVSRNVLVRNRSWRNELFTMVGLSSSPFGFTHRSRLDFELKQGFDAYMTTCVFFFDSMERFANV